MWITEIWNLVRGKTLGCPHEWQENGFGRRTCSLCGEYQMLMHRKFPDIGEPAFSWETMGPRELIDG